MEEGGTFEIPVDAVGNATRHNPLYHTGPIAIFLFVMAFVTGVYVTMFSLVAFLLTRRVCYRRTCPGRMPQDWAEQLSKADVDALVEYLLTLGAE